MTGSFSLPSASGHFVLSVAGGIAVGLAVGWIIRRVRLRLDNPVEITISILSGYFAFLPAYALGVSGVLAAVSAGIYLGWHTLELTSAPTRLQGIAVWEIIFFVLNGLLFALVGLQPPVILDALAGRDVEDLLLYAVLVTAVVIGARFLWVFPTTYLPRLRRRDVLDGAADAPWKGATVIAWAGMRGAVSLAAALASSPSTRAGRSQIVSSSSS